MAERYSVEDKERAVRMVVEDSRTVASVARELGIGARSLGGWVKVLRESRLRRARSEQLVALRASHLDTAGQRGLSAQQVESRLALWSGALRE